ncbi:uncharacterized protein [Aegilops tauschii subsp. strangulata]|uniref:Uncharacterized protein n=1 Tax=Aegilops tauschii TaxID=37682 RepID=M8C2V6_AEGTA
MGAPFSSAVQWWGEWQLHVLALGSLVIQYFLAIFAGCRKDESPPWFRFLTWLAFLGSDAVAIYGLATLFNRQRCQQLRSSAQESHALQVLWAPILLMHLGGQVVITAYNLEDNELWRRHIVTALSQVAVVLWVLYKSWGSPLETKRFKAAAILLFIAGILKCLQKPWALKSASFHSLANSCGPVQRNESREEELKKYVDEAKAFVLSDATNRRTQLCLAPEKLFIDFAYPYCDRLTNLKSFLVDGVDRAYGSLQDGLSDIFEVLYTRKKMKDDDTCLGCCGWITTHICLYPVVIAYLLISGRVKNRVDFAVTTALLFGTALLEHIAPKCTSEEDAWPRRVSQHSVIGYFARNRRHTMLRRFMGFFQCKDLLDQNWSMEPCYSSVDITKLVHRHVLDGWKEYINDAESYREFSDIRGQWSLVRESCDESLGWSLEKPFDESVLLWHMATDFCFHQMDTSTDNECVSPSREISNYMMHLLFMNPEMLMAGSRSNLFKTVYRQLSGILKGESTSGQERRLVQITIDKVKANDDLKETFIHDAWLLAEGLMGIGDES